MIACIVRFYSTVVDWEYIDRMREDLIEIITSKLFGKQVFSDLILQLCCELTRDDDDAYNALTSTFSHCIPKDLGIEPNFTLDHTSDIEKVFMKL